MTSLSTAISDLTPEEVRKVTFAYEPVWAISTFDGQPAKIQDVQKAIDYMRYQISEIYGAYCRSRSVRFFTVVVSIKKRSPAIWLLDGCNGALVGAASLEPESFAEIIDKAYLAEQTKKTL